MPGVGYLQDESMVNVCMYLCISLFRVDQTNSTTIMTNKNRLTSHTDQK